MAKKALITGGNKGIGLATARKLLERGYEVTVVGRDFTGFDLPNVKTVVFNLEDVESIPDLVKEVGEIDVLVNNAGIGIRERYDEYTDASIEKILNVNLKAPVKLITEYSSTLKKRHGRVVNVASQAAEIGHRDLWYGITKAGLVNATKSFSEIIGIDGVVINAVAPGPVRTTMIENSIFEDRYINLRDRTILGRIAEPEEVADVIVWLADEAPEYVNGEVIDINNGAQRIK